MQDVHIISILSFSRAMTHDTCFLVFLLVETEWRQQATSLLVTIQSTFMNLLLESKKYWNVEEIKHLVNFDIFKKCLRTWSSLIMYNKDIIGYQQRTHSSMQHHGRLFNNHSQTVSNSSNIVQRVYFLSMNTSALV